MKRLSDQIMVLQSIKDVKHELKTANANGGNMLEIKDILTRLSTLYACLDVERIANVLRDADTRDQYRKKIS